MQIASTGGLEASMASLMNSVMTQNQVMDGHGAQNGTRASVIDQKSDVDKAQASKISADAADRPVAEPVQVAQASFTSSSGQVEANEGLTQRQLFDYLAEVQKSSSAVGMPPSALIQSGLGALDGTMQKVAEALSRAKGGEVPATGSTGGQQVAQNAPADGQPASLADQAIGQTEQMIDRMMNMMWAAANIQLVMGSVTAVTASTNTLVKQQ